MSIKVKRIIAAVITFVLVTAGCIGITISAGFFSCFGSPEKIETDDMNEVMYCNSNVVYNNTHTLERFLDDYSYAEQYRKSMSENTSLNFNYIDYSDYTEYVKNPSNSYELKDADIPSLIELLGTTYTEYDYTDDISTEYQDGIFIQDKAKDTYSPITDTTFIRIRIRDLVNWIVENDNVTESEKWSGGADYAISYTDASGDNYLYYDASSDEIWTKSDATRIQRYAYIPVNLESENKTGIALLTNGIYSLERVLFGLNYDYVAYTLASNRIYNNYNVTFEINDSSSQADDKTIYTNLKEDYGEYIFKIILNGEESNLSVDVLNKEIDSTNYNELLDYVKTLDLSGYTIKISIDNDFINETYLDIYEVLFSLREYIVVIAVSSCVMLIVAFILLIYLIAIAGKDDDECTSLENLIDKIWLEVLALFNTGVFCLIWACLQSLSDYYVYENIGIRLSVSFVIIACVVMYFVIYMDIFTIVRRIKKKKLVKSFITLTIIFWCFTKIKNGCRNSYRFIEKVGSKRDYEAEKLFKFILFCAIDFVLVSFMCICIGSNAFGVVPFGIVVAFNVYSAVYVKKRAMMIKKIQDGARHIAIGELDYKVDKTDMEKFEGIFAQTINNIGDGLSNAIDDSLEAARKSIKDERLKAELITNVSHDIKTPLTSIINYVDLLKRENIEGDNAIKYLDIIDRKSQRLKMLAEDLVEASKITTGNIELYREPLNYKELLNQALGEFEDKFEEKNLIVSTKMTDKSTVIFADGRRTYRIIDNLLQNVYKYSMQSTRVYIELTNINSTITLSIKNISEAPLNIDPAELTERFKRGDESRTTEGSGLGLSIADSLVKMQGGTMVISIDGDLFKITVSFPESERKMPSIENANIFDNTNSDINTSIVNTETSDDNNEEELTVNDISELDEIIKEIEAEKTSAEENDKDIYENLESDIDETESEQVEDELKTDMIKTEDTQEE